MKPPRSFTTTVTFLFAIIVLLPICYMIVAPFFQEGLNQALHLHHLFEVRHLSLAVNSLGLALGTTIFCLTIGVPLGFLVHRTNLWGRRSFRIGYLIPILIPPFVHAIVWTHLNPAIEQYLSMDIYSRWGAVFVLTFAYYPFVTLMTMSGLRSLDRNLEEAGMLSRGGLHTLRRITLPLITPHIFAGATFVFIFSITDFGVPDILRVNVYPVEIFIQFSALYDEKAAIVLSLPLIAATLSIIIFQKWWMKDRSYVEISGGAGEKVRNKLGRLHVVAFTFCTLILGLSAALPLAVLLKMAGPPATYVKALSTSVDQIGYSFVLAFLGALVALTLGFSLSYLIERTDMRMNVPLSYATLLPLAIPATTVGIGLIKVWNKPFVDIVYGSSWIIVFGYVARFIPFSTITISSGLKQFNPRLEEAAFLATAKWKRVVRKIVLPLSRHSLVTAFFIVFILSFGELGTTLLVIPPGRETLPIKIYNLMHYGAEQMVASLCLVLILIVFAFSGFLFLFHRKLTRLD